MDGMEPTQKNKENAITLLYAISQFVNWKAGVPANPQEAVDAAGLKFDSATLSSLEDWLLAKNFLTKDGATCGPEGGCPVTQYGIDTAYKMKRS
jgi:hypothetical protein